jgi:hypothetical protein
MKIQGLFSQIACLLLLLILWGSAQAQLSGRNDSNSVAQRAPLPFAVVELFTSEG